MSFNSIYTIDISTCMGIYAQVASSCEFKGQTSTQGGESGSEANSQYSQSAYGISCANLVPRPICGRGKNRLFAHARNIPFIQRIFSSRIS